MNDKLLAIFLATLLPSLSFAQAPPNYNCTLQDLQRRVEIFHETGVTVPCEVHYFKDTEAPGESQVLWRAQNEAGYCESKAENFIGKLRNMGWTCVQADGSGGKAKVTEPAGDEEPQAETATSDDTEALEPVEESEPTEE